MVLPMTWPHSPRSHHLHTTTGNRAAGMWTLGDTPKYVWTTQSVSTEVRPPGSQIPNSKRTWRSRLVFLGPSSLNEEMEILTVPASGPSVCIICHNVQHLIKRLTHFCWYCDYSFQILWVGGDQNSRIPTDTPRPQPWSFHFPSQFWKGPWRLHHPTSSFYRKDPWAHHGTFLHFTNGENLAVRITTLCFLAQPSPWAFVSPVAWVQRPLKNHPHTRPGWLQFQGDLVPSPAQEQVHAWKLWSPQQL